MQFDVAALHDGARGDREILPASLLGATIVANAFCLVGMAHGAAVRTDRTIRPSSLFQPLASEFMAMKMRGSEGVGHGLSSICEEILAFVPCGVKSIIMNMIPILYFADPSATSPVGAESCPLPAMRRATDRATTFAHFSVTTHDGYATDGCC